MSDTGLFSILQDAGHLGGEDEHGSIFVNEAAFMSPSLNNRHVHLLHSHHHDHRTHPHSETLGLSDSPSAQNSLNSLLARSNHRRSSVGVSEESWMGGILNSGPLRSQGTESPSNGNNFIPVTMCLEELC